MTATATVSFRDRVERAFGDLQRQEKETETEAAQQRLESARKAALRLIAEAFGPDTSTDGGLRINTSGWGSARFTIGGIPFQVAYQDGEYHSDWHLYVESRCTRAGCTQQDVPALIEVYDITSVAEAVHSRAATHPYGMHCTEATDGGDAVRTRAIVQIAACAWAASLDKEDGGSSETLFALCDDGTLWARETSRGGTKWLRMDAPPIGGAQ